MGAASGRFGGAAEEKREMAPKVEVSLEDLELPPRRDDSQAAATLAQLIGGGAGGVPLPPGVPGAPGGAGGAAAASAALLARSITEEISPGGEPLGQKAFVEDGLVGTEGQQLQLLAHYAELCEDFRLFQRKTRAEGAPRSVDGAQMLLLSGPPGTGKTKHAVSFARALGLPLLVATPPAAGDGGSQKSAAGWAAQLRREVRGRDCAVFLDEVDNHLSDESAASALRQFLDGVCQPTSSRVIVVGTTNRLDRLPKDLVSRAEIVSFDRPETTHLEEMWSGYAQHLREEELRDLATASSRFAATGRDVRHCAALSERRAAIEYLNQIRGQGYCHGAALANCPPPPLASYVRCLAERASVE